MAAPWRRLPPVVACLGAIAALALALPAGAGSKTRGKTARPKPPPTAEAPAPPVTTTPAPGPAPAAEPGEPALEEPAPPRPQPPAAPKPVEAPREEVEAPPRAPAPAGEPARPATPLWQGAFIALDLGYATSGGRGGPLIPDLAAGAAEVSFSYGSFAQWQAKGCLFGNMACYDRAVTTDVGAGFAADLQIGYSILGYASLWADLSWHGSFGSKTDTAGAGTVAVIAALQPLRFWRPDLPVDLRLYAGWGFFEILYYYETEFQPEAKGKAWLGSAIPFGLDLRYRVPDSVFAAGVDLRFVQGAYDEWIWNYDDDVKSKLNAPETTLRFEPRLVLAWHF